MALLLACLGLAGLLFVVLLLADGCRLLWRRRRRAAGQQPLHLRVAERRESAGDLLGLRLVARHGGKLPAFAAGQHVLLQAPAGPGGRPAQRAYSLAAWSAQPESYELGIKREAQGAVSTWAWHNLRVGDAVTLLPPRGEFVVQPAAGELVLIGGGIGITPLRAMLHAALATGRRIVLLHAARQAPELLYREEFAALAERHEHFAYLPCLSAADSVWRGERGRLDAARVLQALAAPAEADFYLCAGRAMMAALRSGLVAAGIAESRIHQESFGLAAAGGPSGQRIQVGAAAPGRAIVTAGEPTLLATLEAHDLAPPAECRAGSCGHCRVRLAAGEVRWLAEPELALAEGEILPCICVPAGDVRIAGLAR